METVIIVIHLMVVVALVGVVLLQRSEGGALGIGGGGFMTARGAANALTRTTAILAAAFFATSIVLGILAKINERPDDILRNLPVTSQPAQTPTEGTGIFDQLAPPTSGQDTAPTEPPAEEPAPADPQVPSGQ